MNFPIRVYALFIALAIYAVSGKAQNAPIGFWESHLPYNTSLGLATDGNTIYNICKQAFFTYTATSAEDPVAYSKVDGMADVGMQAVAYDISTKTLVLVYANGNIDLFKDNTFYNIPALKLKVVAESKKVYQAYAANGMAYLSTAMGILVIDLANYNIKETWEFIKQPSGSVSHVYNFISTQYYFYAATANGLYRISNTSPQTHNSQFWQRLDSVNRITGIAAVNDILYFSNTKSVFTLSADTLTQVYTSGVTIKHIDGGIDHLFISQYLDSTGKGTVRSMDPSNNIVDSVAFQGKPLQVVQLADNSIWIADSANGLKNRADVSNNAKYIPGGPSTSSSFALYAHNKTLYIAHGAYNGLFFASRSYNGFSKFYDGKWTLHKRGSYPPLENKVDIATLIKDESTGTLYVGSYLDGLVIINKDDSVTPLDQNAIFDGSIAYGANAHQIIGLALDKSDNLWVSLLFAEHQLYVKTKEGNWHKFLLPFLGFGGGPVTLDDSGRVWMSSSVENGLVVYDPNKTVTDSTDDIAHHITTGAGLGNLPANGVSCIAKDSKNNMWIGTNNGIAVIKNCPARSAGVPFCDAEVLSLNSTRYPANYFDGKNIKSIAVDGADRKWVGSNEGVLLLSADGQDILEKFTTDNSPMPSNAVQKIYVDKITGDVYIGTDQGLVSYRSTATDGGVSNQDVVIFPNPVPSGYSGTIAIRGLVKEADVRITDINGQLVHHTKALGGQAIWNGVDYTGHRPQTGVYPVFISGGGGKQTYTGKIVFIQ